MNYFCTSVLHMRALIGLAKGVRLVSQRSCYWTPFCRLHSRRPVVVGSENPRVSIRRLSLAPLGIPRTRRINRALLKEQCRQATIVTIVWVTS